MEGMHVNIRSSWTARINAFIQVKQGTALARWVFVNPEYFPEVHNAYHAAIKVLHILQR